MDPCGKPPHEHQNPSVVFRRFFQVVSVTSFYRDILVLVPFWGSMAIQPLIQLSSASVQPSGASPDPSADLSFPDSSQQSIGTASDPSGTHLAGLSCLVLTSHVDGGGKKREKEEEKNGNTWKVSVLRGDMGWRVIRLDALHLSRLNAGPKSILLPA